MEKQVQRRQKFHVDQKGENLFDFDFMVHFLYEGRADAGLIESINGAPPLDFAVGAWEDVAGSKGAGVGKRQSAYPQG